MQQSHALEREAWLDGLRSEAGRNWELSQPGIRFVKSRRSNCLLCRGTKLLCGRPRCPVILRWTSLTEVTRRISSTDIMGSSPPGVFVGRLGYPYVYAGPLIPLETGDTAYLERQPMWLDLTLDDLVRMRASLVRGSFRVRVDRPQLTGRMLELTQELAMAELPVDSEATFLKPPSGNVVFDTDAQPFGPSGIITALSTTNPRVDLRIEDAFYDHDLKAKEGMLELYSDGVEVNAIQRALSVGILGAKRRRRLVPTRWSITAVDSTLGLDLIERIRLNPTVNDHLLFISRSMDNVYLVLLAPGDWSYELIEVFHPGTVWNKYARDVAIGSDYEGRQGRKTYARIGGCYYAARLAVSEYLNTNRRQASVIILREARPSYVLPVGVWHVRESVRRALSSKPERFASLEQALERVSSHMRCPLGAVVRESNLLKSLLSQKSLKEYMRKEDRRSSS